MNYIGVLANFLDVPDPAQRITQVINCNTLSVTQMSRLVLPGMLERGKGLIINISSEAASQPQPTLSVYSATKNTGQKESRFNTLLCPFFSRAGCVSRPVVRNAWQHLLVALNPN